MVTIAVVAVLLGLAAPALRTFIVKNRIAGISNEFSGAILKARGEAIRLNDCVSMCVSTNVQSDKPSCDDKESDWQKGWLLFVNKSCTAETPAAYADILQARTADQAQFTLSANRQILTFTPQGRTAGTNATFELRDAGDAGSPYGRRIVLSLQGRTTVSSLQASSDK